MKRVRTLSFQPLPHQLFDDDVYTASPRLRPAARIPGISQTQAAEQLGSTSEELNTRAERNNVEKMR